MTLIYFVIQDDSKLDLPLHCIIKLPFLFAFSAASGQISGVVSGGISVDISGGIVDGFSGGNLSSFSVTLQSKFDHFFK